MKCLSLVVNTSSKGDIVETLRGMPEVTAYTILEGEGYFGDRVPPFESERDEVLGYVPRIRIDLILEGDKVPRVLEKIRTCGVCSAKLGIYWISPVDELGEI